MSKGELTALQQRVLETLADLQPAWTLTGGGALVGFHLHHEEPTQHAIGGARIRVDTPHEILVNKLCTLVQRSELRDLVDVRELLARGGDLRRALADASKKDSGFSPLTLNWLLGNLAIRDIGTGEGWSDESLSGLEEFRASFIELVGELARPDSV